MTMVRFLILALVFGVCSAGGQSYGERWRPQFHFTPERNWMNDPNGMVYYEGEWHLFYQYNPFGDRWGHMSWGHAVSVDLVHWEHLPVALPEADNVMIFSGSAVVDWKNTSGFGAEGGEPPLVAIYTGHHTDRERQDQRIAYSNDRGRTWKNYVENPVLDIRKADFRDPKVFWHEESAGWVMVVSHPLDRQVGFYGSPDLKHWRPLGEFGPGGSTSGIWECPDLFRLGVEGGDEEKWVLVVNVGGGAPAGGSGCQYFVGEFDGRSFVADAVTHPDLVESGEGEAAVPEGTLIADFEDGYGGWVATGDAFGAGPAGSALEGQQSVAGFLGKGFVNSFSNRDKGTGTLTSPAFDVTEDFVNFMIGGGAHPGRTCLNLSVGGEVVRTATGSEDERLRWQSWDVRDLRGKRAVLQVVDDETGGWGHLNVDHIVLSAAAVAAEEPVALWADWGRDFYAAVSWSDVPEADGRRVWIGWMSNWQYAQDVPTSPWRSAMTVPRSLMLRKTGDGYRMLQVPVRELEVLREATVGFGGGTVAESNVWLAGVGGRLLDVELVVAGEGDLAVEIGGVGGEEILVRVRGDELSLDRRKSGEVGFSEAFAGEHVAPLRRGEGGRVTLRLLLDVSSVEVFANGGESVISDLVLPEAGDYSLRLSGDGVKVLGGSVSRLKPAWGNR